MKRSDHDHRGDKTICIENDIYQSNSNVNQLLILELTTGKNIEGNFECGPISVLNDPRPLCVSCDNYADGYCKKKQNQRLLVYRFN